MADATEGWSFTPRCHHCSWLMEDFSPDSTSSHRCGTTEDSQNNSNVRIQPFLLFPLCSQLQTPAKSSGIDAFFFPAMSHVPPVKVLPAAGMERELELRLGRRPPAAQRKTSQQPRLYRSQPRKRREDSHLQVLLCHRCQIQTKGRRTACGWQPSREQAKQTTHRRSPALTARRVVKHPPVGVNLAPQKQEQRRQ